MRFAAARGFPARQSWEFQAHQADPDYFGLLRALVDKRSVIGTMGQRPVVLVVDDDSMTRELLSTMLAVDGRFRIGGVAEDGFEGAMLAADLNPDVVILDFYMPRWDGAKAAEFIRGHCPRTKILAFSAVLDAHPDWADDFLVKTEVDRLLGLVGELAGAA